MSQYRIPVNNQSVTELAQRGSEVQADLDRLILTIHLGFLRRRELGTELHPRETQCCSFSGLVLALGVSRQCAVSWDLWIALLFDCDPELRCIITQLVRHLHWRSRSKSAGLVPHLSRPGASGVKFLFCRNGL